MRSAVDASRATVTIIRHTFSGQPWMSPARMMVAWSHYHAAGTPSPCAYPLGIGHPPRSAPRWPRGSRPATDHPRPPSRWADIAVHTPADPHKRRFRASAAIPVLPFHQRHRPAPRNPDRHRPQARRAKRRPARRGSAGHRGHTGFPSGSPRRRTRPLTGSVVRWRSSSECARPRARDTTSELVYDYWIRYL
jgi:hypothetical protein